MTGETKIRIALARATDAPAFGRLLYAFKVEFERTPEADVIAKRAAPLIESGQVTVLFAGHGSDGFAELRFRPSLYTGALDAYLEELYVVPERHGHGLGRALLDAVMDHARKRGAARIDLGTSENDMPPGRSTRAPVSPTTKAAPTGRGCSTTSGTWSSPWGRYRWSDLVSADAKHGGEAHPPSVRAAAENADSATDLRARVVARAAWSATRAAREVWLATAGTRDPRELVNDAFDLLEQGAS